MSTAFNDLTDWVRDVLVQTTALAGGNVHRGRLRPMPEEHTTSIVIRLVRAAGEQTTMLGTELAWQTTIEIDLYARATPAQEPEDAIDQLLADVYSRLIAATLPTGVTEIRPFEEIAWEFGEADSSLICATLRVAVEHEALLADLSAPD